jgi:hypothetical protein
MFILLKRFKARADIPSETLFVSALVPVFNPPDFRTFFKNKQNLSTN